MVQIVTHQHCITVELHLRRKRWYGDVNGFGVDITTALWCHLCLLAVHNVDGDRWCGWWCCGDPWEVQPREDEVNLAVQNMSISNNNLLFTWNINCGPWDWWFPCSARWGQCITALLHSLTAACSFSSLHTQRKTEPVVNCRSALKACFEASSWVITDTRRNSETAAANTFISTGCCRPDVAASESSTVPVPLVFLSLAVRIVSLLLCTDVVLFCVLIVCQMILPTVWRIRSTKWVLNKTGVSLFLHMSFMLCKLLHWVVAPL